MRTAAQIKQELLELQDTYIPLGETAAHIKDISIAMVIGATCVGKSTIIKEVTRLDDEFSNPGGFTTRELRPTDAKSYRHLDNSSESLADFLESVKNGEPVQYNIYDTGHIYGSEVKDYTTPFSILDTQYSAVKNLERAGFESAHPIALATTPEQYERQLRIRFGANPDRSDMKTRLTEGDKSLSFCLEQDDKIAWVVNRAVQTEAAAYEVIGLTRGYRRQAPDARLIGEKLLNKIRQLSS